MPFAASASEWWEGAHVTQTCNRSILPVQKSGRGNIGGGLNGSTQHREARI